MKNIFGINVTENRKNTEFDGAEFITKRVSETRETKINDAMSGIKKFAKKASLPVWLTVVKYTAAAVIFISVISCLVRIDKIRLSAVYETVPALVYANAISLILFVILVIVGYIKRKSVYRRDDLTVLIQDARCEAAVSRRELEIPGNSVEIDVMMFRYKEKQGRMKISNPFLTYYKYTNFSPYVFLRDDCLCFATLAMVMSFPLDSIKKIRKINKEASLSSWNKDESCDSKKYKKYKIKANSYGVFKIKEFYALTIEKDGEKYELFIPGYDINSIVGLTCIKPVE
ncbi:MAG: hypothetical protein PHW77_09310 [Eubacteriales bacterium]|nr:hypothetical protein [Eubacteriales bacterium]